MGVKNIEDKFLDERDLIALRYKEGLVFMEVEEQEDLEYEKFSHFDDISAGGTSTYERPTANGDDRPLEVPSQKPNTILHHGIGVAPSDVDMWIAYPEGDRSRGSYPDVSSNPTPGSEIGKVSSKRSPFNNPTEYSELIVPPKVDVKVAFENTDQDNSKTPVLNIRTRRYTVEVLEADDSINKNAIKRIVSPGSPVPIKAVGHIGQKVEYNMADEWGVSPMTKSEARRKVHNNNSGRSSRR